MAPLPVIPDVFRVTINGHTLAGVKPHNVFHVASPTGNVSDIADAINNAMPLSLWYPVPGAMQPTTMDIIPLDGTSASQTRSLTDWNAEGGSEFIPEASAVVSLHTATRGPSGRGRQFIGPLGEANTASGTVDGTTVSTLQTDWEGFATALDGSPPGMGLVVASYVNASYAPVTSLTVKTEQATQRRRLLQQR